MFKFIFTLLVTLNAFTIFAASQGENLEREMWLEIKAKNWGKVESHIAPFFQSVHSDGARSKDEEIALIKKLMISDYILSNFKVTENKDTLIVTYIISVAETIDAKHLPNKPTPRISVWQNVNGNWQWVAHANLNPIFGLH